MSRKGNSYLNYISPHPPPLKSIGQGQSPEGLIRIDDTNKGDGTNDAARCVNGCLDATEFGYIAHYFAGDKRLLKTPYNSPLDSPSPFNEPYDPIPGQSSCKVVTVPTKEFYDYYGVDPYIWLPCWIVSSPAHPSEHAHLTVPKISTSAVAMGTPYIPLVTTRQRLQYKRTNIDIVTTTSFGTERDRLVMWEPGSGILVVEVPHIVPRSWLHRIRPETMVILTLASRSDVKKVFENRHLVATDEKFEGCHLVSGRAESVTVAPT